MKQKFAPGFWKRSLCKGLSLAVAVTMIPSVGVQAAPKEGEGQPAAAGSVEATESMTTREQPFTVKTGSANFSSPAFVVRQIVEGERASGTTVRPVRPTDPDTGVDGAQQSDLLIAAAEMKYDTTADGGGQDIITSVSSDNGATWKYSFPFYFPDSVGNGVEGATSVSNPVVADAERLNNPSGTGGDVKPGFVMGGTTYLFANVYPGGVAVSSDSRFEAPKAGSGYIEIGEDGSKTKRLALTASLDKTSTNPTASGAGYEYYVGDFESDGYAKVLNVSDNAESNYKVDKWYNLYKKEENGSNYTALTQNQLGSAASSNAPALVQQNVFYKDSELHVYKTGYVMCVTSEDDGDTWSEPEILNASLYETEDVLYTLESGKGLYTSGKRIVIPATVQKGDTQAAAMLWKCTTDESHGWHHADVPAISAEEGNSSPTWTRGGEIVELSKGHLRMFVRTGRTTVYYADAARGLSEEEGEASGNSDMFTFTAPVSTASSITADAKITAINYSRQVNPGADNAGKVILAAMPTGSGHTNGLLLTFEKNGGTDENPTITRHGNGYSLYRGNFAMASLDEMYYGSKIGMLWEHGKGTIRYEQYQTLDVLDNDLFVPYLEYDLELDPDDDPYTRSYQVTGTENFESADRDWAAAGNASVGVSFNAGTATKKKVPSLYSISTHSGNAKKLEQTFGAAPDASVRIENAEFTLTRPSEANTDVYTVYSEAAQRYLTNAVDGSTFFTTTLRNNMKVVGYDTDRENGFGEGWMVYRDNDTRCILFDPAKFYSFDSNSSIGGLTTNTQWTMHLQLLKKLTAEELAAMEDKSNVVDFTGEAGDLYKYLPLGADDQIQSGRQYLIGYKVDANAADTRFPNGGYVVLYPRNMKQNYGKLIYGIREADVAAQKTLTITPKAAADGVHDLTVNNITYHITVKYETIQINKNGSAFIDNVSLEDVDLGETTIVTPQGATEERRVLFDCKGEADNNLSGYDTTPNWNANVENAEFIFTKVGETDDGRTTYHIFNELENNYLVNQNATNYFTSTAVAQSVEAQPDGENISFEIRRYDPNNTNAEQRNRYMYFYYKRMAFDALDRKNADFESKGDFKFELLTKKANGVESYTDPIPGYERASKVESGKSYLITEFYTDRERGDVVLVMYPRTGIVNQSKLFASTEVEGVRLSASNANEGDKANITIDGKTYTIEIIGECDHSDYGVTITEKPATCLEEGYRDRTVCKNCKSVVNEGTKLEKLNHTWDGEWEVTTAPTYNTDTHATTDGVKTQTCSGGESTKTKAYPATEKIQEDMEALITAINALKTGDTEYAKETLAALDTALAKADGITEVTAENQNAAMDAIAAMREASDEDNLITKSEYTEKETEFLTLYNTAKTEIAKTDLYTQTSIDALQQVLDDIDEMKDEEGNLNYADLLTAIERLQENPLKTKESETCEKLVQDLKAALTDQVKAIAEAGQKNYTDETWKPFKAAYDAVNGKTDEELMALGSEQLAKLLSDLKIKLVEKPSTPQTGTQVKDGQVFTIASGTYQVASAKDKTVIITKGKDAKTVKVGPTVVINKETYKVIGIGKKAFSGLKSASKVVINANIKTIGEQAFEKSKKLKNVTIGKDVNKIGKKAFANCPKLNKVIIKGKALKNKGIGKQAFSKTAKKATVKWPKGLKSKDKNKLKKAIKKAGLKVK